MTNKRICPSCKKEKESVGPKIVAKTKSNDPHLARQNDVLITKIMCQDCYEALKGSLGEFTQKCLNPGCDNILFVSGRLSPDADLRGVDRNISFKNDSKGMYLECPKCGAKHDILTWQGSPGSGGRWKISGLQT